MKLKKAPGRNGIVAEHLKYGGPHCSVTVHVHLCLLFNAKQRHAFVLDDFGHGVILPLLKDKHGDSSKVDKYRVRLTPTLYKNVIIFRII